MDPYLEWPEHDRPVWLDELVKPLVALFRQGYRVTRINRDKDIKYAGYAPSSDLPEEDTMKEVRKQLSAASLADMEDREGRFDMLLEKILSIAVRVGMEQGVRMERSGEGGE